MSRVKVARKSTAIDMTAMCDVAFLLLTFFILSAKPKTQDPVKAEVPASTAVMPIPETDFAIITVGEDKAFFTIEGDDLRRATLATMATEYKLPPFTAEETKKFASTEAFGVPLANMHQFLQYSANDLAALKQPGIPVDTNKVNDLANWVLQTRKAAAALHNVELRVAIRGDAQENYPIINTIIKTLQKQHVDKFSLITSAKVVAK